MAAPFRTALPVLVAALLAACQAAPAGAPARVGLAAGTGQVMLVPSVAGGATRRLMAEIAPYTAASIHHLVVTLADQDQPSTVLATASVPASDLYNTITFGNLANGRTYVVAATAYDDASEVAAHEISVAGSSRTTLVVGTDDRPTLGNLVVTLRDRTFSGTARSGGLTVNGGGVTHQGSEGGALHGTLAFNLAEDVDLTGSGDGLPGRPRAAAVTAAGDVYFTDYDRSVVWKLPGGEGPPEVFAGTPDSNATFNQPGPIAVGPDGALYVGDFTTVKRVAPDGAVTTVAGAHGDNGDRPTDAEGSVADARDARFIAITGLAFTRDGALVVADAGNGRLLHVTPGGAARNLCAKSTFSWLGAVAVGRDGKYYAAVPFASKVVQVTDGAPATIADFAGSGVNGADDGPRLQAKFQAPQGLAFDKAGWLYVGDGPAIRRVSPRGEVTTLAGDPATAGNATGSLFVSKADPGEARFNGVFGLVVGPAGDLLAADNVNQRLARVFEFSL